LAEIHPSQQNFSALTRHREKTTILQKILQWQRPKVPYRDLVIDGLTKKAEQLKTSWLVKGEVGIGKLFTTPRT